MAADRDRVERVVGAGALVLRGREPGVAALPGQSGDHPPPHLVESRGDPGEA